MTLDSLYRNPVVRTSALALTIAALIFMLWQSDEAEPDITAEALRGDSEPDGFVIGGQLLTYNEQGDLTARFESVRLEQFEDKNLFRMKDPAATLYGPTGEVSWQGRANEGEFRQTDEIALLTGQVRITRHTKDSQPLELSTTSLTLNNANRTIYTDEAVVITDALGITQSVGMKAWIDDRILELHAQVEGRYETAQ